MATKAEKARAGQNEWLRKPANDVMPPEAVEAIARRRRQLLLHSHIYYELNSNIIDDHTFDLWGRQLVKLHKKYGKRIGFFDKLFSDWDASTGFHLAAMKIPNVAHLADRLLRDHHAGHFDPLLMRKRTAMALQQPVGENTSTPATKRKVTR